MSRFGRIARSACGLAVGLVLAGSVWAAAAQAGPVAEPTVHLRGIVYTFDNHEPIEGATVRIAELADPAAVSAADGTYDLEVPDGTRVTPYVEATGHHAIYLQTFVTAGRDLKKINFQVPSEGVYAALAAIVDAERDAEGELVNCALVSTFVNEAVRDLSFDEFFAFGPHGVAGATASTVPALPGPVYFNESVIPDPSRTESSVDGGVIWTEVPAGVYRVSGQHPSERFADFVGTCEPGRVVNANPPQGLYQLRPGETVDETVDAEVKKAKFVRKGKRRTLRFNVAAGEYVSVAASLTRRGKEIAAMGGSDDAGDYAPGARKLSLRVPRKTKPGKVKLRTQFSDPSANQLDAVEKLRLPKVKKRR